MLVHLFMYVLRCLYLYLCMFKMSVFLSYHLTLKYFSDKLIKCLQKLLSRIFSFDFAYPEE